MRKFSCKVFFFIIVVVVGVTLWLTLHGPADPIYQEKRLTLWLQQYDYPSQDADTLQLDWQKTDEAVRHIGTNAIPMLLYMLRFRDSSLTHNLIQFAQRQQMIKINYVTAERRNFEAAKAFQTLGVTASNAIPQLIRIYTLNNSTESQSAIIASIGEIGPAAKSAIPLLLKAATATNMNPTVWENSLIALGSIHSEPEVVLPALENIIHDPRKLARLLGVLDIGEFGTNALPATASLLELLKDQDIKVRGATLSALGRIYFKPEWGPPVSDEWKTEDQSATITRTINNLSALGTNAEPAVPALLKFLTDADEGIRSSATKALKAIDAEAAAKAGVK